MPFPPNGCLSLEQRNELQTEGSGSLSNGSDANWPIICGFTFRSSGEFSARIGRNQQQASAYFLPLSRCFVPSGALEGDSEEGTRRRLRSRDSAASVPMSGLSFSRSPLVSCGRGCTRTIILHGLCHWRIGGEL